MRLVGCLPFGYEGSVVVYNKLEPVSPAEQKGEQLSADNESEASASEVGSPQTPSSSQTKQSVTQKDTKVSQTKKTLLNKPLEDANSGVNLASSTLETIVKKVESGPNKAPNYKAILKKNPSSEMRRVVAASKKLAQNSDDLVRTVGKVAKVGGAVTSVLAVTDAVMDAYNNPTDRNVGKAAVTTVIAGVSVACPVCGIGLSVADAIVGEDIYESVGEPINDLIDWWNED